MRELVDIAFEHVGLDPEDHVRIDPSASCARPRSSSWSATPPRRARSSAGSRGRRFEELVRLMVDADLELLEFLGELGVGEICVFENRQRRLEPLPGPVREDS